MKPVVLSHVLFVVAILMLGLSACSAREVPQPLEKGDAFQFTVEAGKVSRPVNRRVMGFSFHNMWDYTPLYSLSTGEWIVNEHATKAIQELKVPFGRTLWVDPASAGGAYFGVKGGIDRAAEMCRHFGIPQEQFVLEVEAQEQARALSPEAWAEAVRYSHDKGYGFRLWEVCNEPYNVWGSPRSEAWTAEPYKAHVKAVYQAVKAAQPDAQIGFAAGLSPFNQWGATQTEDPLISELAGYYDFIAPHFYCHLQNLDQLPLERITLGGNAWVLNSYVVKTRELLDKYNPGRHIEILDTEWAMHGYNSGDDSRADTANRNGNIAGTLHRAVRLIYYLNEGLVEAAAQFMAVGPRESPGFTIVPLNDERLFTPYYLNYYLSRYVGDEVVDVSGTCPYYEKAGIPSDYTYTGAVYDVSMPKAPVLVTRSADGKTLYLVIANGTATESLPCHVNLKGFRVASVEGKRLSQSSIDAPALVEKESDVISALPVQVSDGGQGIEFECSPHSVSFISLSAAITP